MVDAARDGRMAMALLDRNDYDLVLCDVQMPNVGGLALYDTIRQRLPHLLDRFVLISGDILNAQLHALNDSAKVSMLSKPFDAAKLDAVLNEVFARRVGRPQVAAVYPY